MSYITVTNAKVDRHLSTGTGYSIVESYESKLTGKTVNTYFTVWSSDLLEIGTVVKVSGRYSDMLKEQDPSEGSKTFINRSINDPKVEVLQSASPMPATATASPIDENAPF